MDKNGMKFTISKKVLVEMEELHSVTAMEELLKVILKEVENGCNHVEVDITE